MRLLILAALIAVVPASERLTNRVVLVIDHSGSMAGRYGAAVDAARHIAQQPTDDLTLSCIAFNAETQRYPKTLKLPDAEGVSELVSWLSNLRAHGSTLAGPALSEALKMSEKGLSVVLVTDGVFTAEPIESLLAQIEAAQQWRVDQGLGRAVVAVYGIGLESATLRRIGEAGKGGYYRERVK